MQIYPSFKPFSLHPLPPGQDNQPFILNTSSASSNLSSVIEEGRTPLLFNCSIAKHSHKFIAERFVGSKATLFHSLSFSYAHQYHQERNVNCGIKRLRYNWQFISKQQATTQRERGSSNSELQMATQNALQRNCNRMDMEQNRVANKLRSYSNKNANQQTAVQPGKKAFPVPDPSTGNRCMSFYSSL